MSQGGAAGAAERGEGGGPDSTMGQIRGLVSRWPDADVVLQGGMSEGLRDWDLWYDEKALLSDTTLANVLTGVHSSSASCCHSSSASTHEKTSDHLSSVVSLQ